LTEFRNYLELVQTYLINKIINARGLEQESNEKTPTTGALDGDPSYLETWRGLNIRWKRSKFSLFERLLE
jgi:hypothetical protein